MVSHTPGVSHSVQCVEWGLELHRDGTPQLGSFSIRPRLFGLSWYCQPLPRAFSEWWETVILGSPQPGSPETGSRPGGQVPQLGWKQEEPNFSIQNLSFCFWGWFPLTEPRCWDHLVQLCFLNFIINLLSWMLVQLRKICNLLSPMSAAQTWKKISGGQPQSSVLNFDLYNIFTNDWVENITDLFTKFLKKKRKKKADCKNINRIQMALDSLDWWAESNKIK